MATQRLSTYAALRCKDPEFWKFLRVPDEATAAHSVRAICGIKSRSELDSNPEAAKRFHQFVRLAYQEFTHNQEKAACQT